MRKPWLLLLAAVAGALSVTPFAHATNGSKPIASGARAGGRGGVDTGFADDATAINTNPGGIGFIDGQRFDSASAWVHPTIRFSGRNALGGSGDPSGESHANAFGGSMAVVFDFDEPWHLGEVFTFEDSGAWTHEPRTSPRYQGSGLKLGFGIFPVKGARIKMHATTPFWDEDIRDPSDPADDVPRERKQYFSDIKEVAFSLAFAMRITEWLSIGIAPSFIWGEINQNAPLAQPTSILKGHPGGGSGSTGVRYADIAPFAGIASGEIIGFSKIHHARTYGGRVRFGAMLQPTENISIGISYATPSFSQDYLGKGEVDFSRQIRKIDDPDLVQAAIAADTGIPPEDQTFIGEVDVRIKPLEQPHEVSLGVAFRFEYVAFGVDVTWFNWSATHDRFEARLTNGTSGELNELTGDEKDSVKAGFPLDWEDQFVFAFGVTVQPTDWLAIRAGYNYGKNPVPNDTLQPLLPAITEHHVTAGISIYWRRWEFTLNYEHDLRATETIEDSRVNSDLNGTEVEIEIQFIAFGVGVRF